MTITSLVLLVFIVLHSTFTCSRPKSRSFLAPSSRRAFANNTTPLMRRQLWIKQILLLTRNGRSFGGTNTRSFTEEAIQEFWQRCWTKNRDRRYDRRLWERFRDNSNLKLRHFNGYLSSVSGISLSFKRFDVTSFVYKLSKGPKLCDRNYSLQTKNWYTLADSSLN